jgi:hypothetical protein
MNFREQSVNFEEQSVNFREQSANLREHRANFGQHSVVIEKQHCTFSCIKTPCGRDGSLNPKPFTLNPKP